MRYTYATFKGKDQARTVYCIGPVVVLDSGQISTEVACGFDIKKAAFLVTLQIDREELYPKYDEMLVTCYDSSGRSITSLEHRVEQIRHLCSRYSCLMLVGYQQMKRRGWPIHDEPIDLAYLNARYKWEINYETTIITDGDGWLPIMPVSDVPVLSEVADFPCVFGKSDDPSGYSREPYSVTQQVSLNYKHSTDLIKNNAVLRHVAGHNFCAVPSVRKFYSLGKQNKRMIKESIRRFFVGSKELVRR